MDTFREHQTLVASARWHLRRPVLEKGLGDHSRWAVSRSQQFPEATISMGPVSILWFTLLKSHITKTSATGADDGGHIVHPHKDPGFPLTHLVCTQEAD